MQEKLTGVERQLSTAAAEHGRQQRDAVARLEQQTRRVDALQSELDNVQQHLERAKYARSPSTRV